MLYDCTLNATIADDDRSSMYPGDFNLISVASGVCCGDTTVFV
jgi:hypothetical protein